MACDQLAPLCLTHPAVTYMLGSRALFLFFIQQIFIEYLLCARHLLSVDWVLYPGDSLVTTGGNIPSLV